MRDMRSNVKTLTAVKPQNKDGDGAVTGVAIDRLTFREAVFSFNSGVATGSPTAVAIACKIQECDESGGTYADVAGATVDIDAADQHKEIELFLGPRKQFLKAVMTVTLTGGTSPAIDLSADVVLGNPVVLPAA